MPAEHAVAFVAPVEQKYPFSHVVHSAAAVRFVKLECVPFLHGTGSLEPSGQYEPSSHGKQPVEFVCDAYVPAWQNVHLPSRMMFV